MTKITPQMILDLRQQTGAGPRDCNHALIKTDGDMQKAMTFLDNLDRGPAITYYPKGRTMTTRQQDSAIIELGSKLVIATDRITALEKAIKKIKTASNHTEFIDATLAAADLVTENES